MVGVSTPPCLRFLPINDKTVVLNHAWRSLRNYEESAGHSLTLQVTRRCKSQTRSSKSAASCPDPAFAQSTDRVTALSSLSALQSCPCCPPQLWSLTGSFLLLPPAPCTAGASAAAAPSVFAPDRRALSSPPPVRSGGWRAAASRSAPRTVQMSFSPHHGSAFLIISGERSSRVCVGSEENTAYPMSG